MNFHNRATAFGSGGSFQRTQTPMTDDQLRAVAPSIFAEGRHSSRSERFGYVPTIDVLNGLRREGFEPFFAKQGGSRDEEKRGFTKHMVRLRRVGVELTKVGDSLPEIVLMNAHDGTSTYKLMYGFLKLACLNGLIVPDRDQAHTGINVPHKGDIVGQVIEGTYSVLDQAEAQAGRIEAMQSVDLMDTEALAFARSALVLRYGEEEAPIRAEDVLTPRRREDYGRSLWQTFNRVQENLARGGISYSQRNERGSVIARRNTRPVNSVDGDVKLNRALWLLAEQMAEIKRA